MRLTNSRLPAALAVLASMFLTVPASAGSVDRCGGEVGSCADGFIGVYKDKTYWDLTIEDNQADANCAYAKVIVDRNNRSDQEFRSPNACRKGNKEIFRGNTQYSGTRGARIEVCVDRNNSLDKCTKIHYEYEIE